MMGWGYTHTSYLSDSSAPITFTTHPAILLSCYPIARGHERRAMPWFYLGGAEWKCTDTAWPEMNLYRFAGNEPPIHDYLPRYLGLPVCYIYLYRFP